MTKCYWCGNFTEKSRRYCSDNCKKEAYQARTKQVIDTMLSNPRKILDSIQTKLPDTTLEEEKRKQIEKTYFYIRTSDIKTEYTFPIKLSYKEVQLANDLMRWLDIDKTRLFRIALRQLHQIFNQPESGSQQEQCQTNTTPASFSIKQDR